MKVLHISGLNTVSEVEVKNLLEKFSAPMLVKFKADKDQETDECQRPAGEIYFSSISESLEALILVNNRSWSKFKELYSYHGILLYRKIRNGTISLQFSTAEESVTFRATVHSQPNWLQDLKGNFFTEIVSGCSARTLEAVDKNEDIEVERYF